MLSKFFLAKGIIPVIINNALEVPSHIRKEKYDVILMDIAMPKFSGIDVIKKLETDNILQNQNIFIFSGALNYHDEIRGLLKKEGIRGFLKKPIELDEILKVITKDSDVQKTNPSKTA